MNVILFDDPALQVNLLPFTYTRPVSRIRVGILTIEEKWSSLLKSKPSFLTQNYLQEKFPLTPHSDNLLINGAICPDKALAEKVMQLQPGQALKQGATVIATRQKEVSLPPDISDAIEHSEPFVIIDKVWKIFSTNGAQIKSDFALLTAGKKSASIADPHTIIYGDDNIFVEEGVDVKAAILNAETGPIYLGKNSVVQEGAMIRGPFALCAESHVNMGAKMRGDVTIGPFSKVGGEVSASVIFGYSNKAHDGFLGCSVLGEWCNLGADTNTSNLKNNYDNVKLWSHGARSFVNTGLQFCGLMMGDHSKSAINTMFNTGTVVDVACNVFGEGFPRNYLPSFSWGGASSLTTHQLTKAIETAERVFARRGMTMDEKEKKILEHVFDLTASNRTSE